MDRCQIVVNGAPRAIAAGLPVEVVVATITPGTDGIAVAVNGAVVPRGRWADERLRDGDTVEIIAAVQGG